MEDRTISALVSLKRAGEELGLDRRVVKGAALALGIELQPAGASLVMSREDLDRLRSRLRGDEEARKGRAVTVG